MEILSGENITQSKLALHFKPTINNNNIEGAGSGKPNTLLGLIKHKCDDAYDVINKIYLYVKGPN